MVERIGQLERHGVKSYDSLVNWSFASTGAEVIDDYLFGTPSPGELVFEDNFEGSTLNTSNWTVVTGSGSVIDGGEEYYAENKVGVSSGNLSLGLSTGTVTNFINHVSIDVPANGTTTHSFNSYSGTVVAGSGFRPTPGSLLVLVVADYVPTISTPTGWTLGASIGGQAWTNVYYKIATGSDDVTVTHNFSGYPMMADYYEFTAGTTWVNAVTAGSVANGGAGPTLSGLTGNNWVAAVATEGITTSNGSNTFTWNNGTEAVDYNSVGASVTYSYSLSYRANYGSATASSVATSTSVTSHDQVIFAVKPPTSTETVLGGRVYSKYKINAHYGRIEARIQLPAGGQGLWPAFWMMGDESAKGLWPRNGEIDILESINDMSRVYGSVHGPTVAAPGTQWSNETYYVPTASPITGFHTYAIEWGPDVIHWYFDNIKYKTLKVSDVDTTTNSWPFNDTFAYLILNVAYGGVMAGASNGTAVLPQSMLVDYVRVYERQSYSGANSKVDTLKTRFADAREINVDGTIATISGGTLNVTPTTSYYNGNTQRRFDLTDSSIFYSIAQLPNVGTGTISAFMKIDHIMLAGAIKSIEYGWNGNLYTHETVAAGSDTFTAYNATTMRFLRVRHQSSNNTLYWDYSPDAYTWTNFRSQVISPYADVTNVDVLFLAGYYGTEPSPGVAKFDNINYATPVASLSDDFSNGTVDSTWTINAAGVTETSSVMRLLQTTTNHSPEVTTANAYALENDAVTINVNTWNSTLNTGGYTEIRWDTANPETTMALRYNIDTSSFITTIGGITQTGLISGYGGSGGAFAWVRFANAAGVTTIDYSADGSTWNNLAAVDQSAIVGTNQFIGKLAFKSSSTNLFATSASFDIEGVNTAPSTLVTKSAVDGFAVTIAESRTQFVTVATTDTAALTIAETNSFFDTIAATEATAVTIAESRTQNATIATVDTAALTIAEINTITNAFGSTDTTAVTIAETDTTSNTFASTDTAALTIVESRNVDVPTPGTESTALSISETNTILVTVNTTDTAALTISETSGNYIPVATTDTTALTIAETDTTAVSLATTDTTAVTIAETDTGAITFASTDTTAVTIAEARSLNVLVATTDTTAVTIAETDSNANSVATTETTAVTIAEVSAVFVTVNTTDTAALTIAETDTGFITASATETTAVTISEVAGIGATSPGTETTALGITETTSIVVSFASTETTAVTIAESRTQAVSVATTDTASVTVADVSAVQNGFATTDTSSVSIGDVSSLALNIQMSTTDTAALTIAESNSFFDTLSATDGFAVTIAETNSSTLSVSTTDTTAVTISETDSGSIVFASSDTSSLTITEVTNAANNGPAADSIAVGIDEQSFVFVSLAASDTSSVTIAEARAQAVSLATTDTGALTIAETDSTTNGFSTSDTTAVTIAESAGNAVTQATTDTAALTIVETNTSFRTIDTVDTSSVSVTETSNPDTSAPASDSVAIGITEQTTTFATVDTTDVSSVSIVDGANVHVVGLPDDGSSMTISESSDIFVTMASTDALVLVFDENGTVAGNSPPASDSSALAIVESVTTFVSLATTDTSALSIAETANNAVTFASTDGFAVSIAETNAFTRFIDAVDGFSVIIDEITFNFINKALSTTDTTALSIGETSGVFMNAPGVDSTAVTISEQASVSVSGGNSLASSDSLDMVVSEGASVLVKIVTSDTAALTIAETNSGFITAVASDTTAVSTAESINDAVRFASVDSSGIAIGETNSIALTGAAYGDSLDLVITEQAFINPLASGTDFIAVRIDEISSVLIGGVVQKSATDTFAITITETHGSMTLSSTRSDTSALSVSETTTGDATMTAYDTSAVSIVESSTRPLWAYDGSAVGISETNGLSKTDNLFIIEASDELVLAVQETYDMWVFGKEHTAVRFATNADRDTINLTESSTARGVRFRTSRKGNRIE